MKVEDAHFAGVVTCATIEDGKKSFFSFRVWNNVRPAVSHIKNYWANYQQN